MYTRIYIIIKNLDKMIKALAVLMKSFDNIKLKDLYSDMVPMKFKLNVTPANHYNYTCSAWCTHQIHWQPNIAGIGTSC